MTGTGNSMMKILTLAAGPPSSMMCLILEDTLGSVQLPPVVFWAISPEISNRVDFQRSRLDTPFLLDQDNIKAGKVLLKKWVLGTDLRLSSPFTHLRLSKLDLPVLKDLQSIGRFSLIRLRNNCHKSVSARGEVVLWADLMVHGVAHL